VAYGKRLVAVGVAALIVGLVLTFPARIAYQWFAPGQVALSGISGSVWSGAAAQGSAAGLFLSDITWSFRPLSLLRLKPGYAITAKLPSGFFETGIAIGSGSSVQFDDLTAVVALSSLPESLLPMPGVGGDLNLQFSTLVLTGGSPTEVEGTAGVSGLVLPALAATALGDYRVQVQTEDGVITGTVEDVSGVLDVNGRLVVDRDKAFSFIGHVAGGPNAPSAVNDQLRFLGSPDQQGRREFRFEGTL
jgi:general secretion pathway protein N